MNARPVSYIETARRGPREFSPRHLPGGGRLQWTLERRALYRSAVRVDGGEGECPKTLADALMMLFLAGNPRAVWTDARVLPGDGGTRPALEDDVYALLNHADGWAAEVFRPNEEDLVIKLAVHLWNWHALAEVKPVESGPGTGGASSKSGEFLTLWPDAEDQTLHCLSRGETARWEWLRTECPLRDVYKSLHCWYVAQRIPVTTPRASANAKTSFAARYAAIRNRCGGEAGGTVNE